MSSNHADSQATTRLNKLVAQRGFASRREADTLIFAGHVRVNGVVITTPGYQAPSDATIELDASATKQQSSLITVLLNKPVGYVSAQAEKGYKPAVTLLTKQNAAFENAPRIDWKTLAAAGRLDIDSEGLLVLTADGRVARSIINPQHTMDKEYVVRYSGTLTPSKLKLLRFGLSLDGKPLLRAGVDELNDDQLRITLHEGRKRQIRRMLEAVELRVMKLQRVRIGKVRLGKLPLGAWRLLRDGESF